MTILSCRRVGILGIYGITLHDISILQNIYSLFIDIMIGDRLIETIRNGSFRDMYLHMI